MKKIIVLLAALLMPLTVVSVADAARALPTGTITGGTVFSYGGSATFSTTISGRVPNKGYVYVLTVCWTDVEFESPVVYQWSKGLNVDGTVTFPFIDQAGQGLDWNGESANCAAVLYYREDNGPRGSSLIEELDRHDFSVVGNV